MVMELMTGGELFDRVVEKEQYTEGEARDCVKQICLALVYCHNRGIVHRDLKPENLLYESAEDSSALKIADFGLAKIVSDDAMMQTACGTPGYVAPEILKSEPYDSEVDMWSVGVITCVGAGSLPRARPPPVKLLGSTANHRKPPLAFSVLAASQIHLALRISAILRRE